MIQLQGAQLVKDPPAVQETPVQLLGGGKIRWRRDRLPTPVFLGFPGGSAGRESARSARESAHSARDPSSIPGLGRSPREGTGYPLQYSGLYMDCTVHGITKS